MDMSIAFCCRRLSQGGYLQHSTVVRESVGCHKGHLGTFTSEVGDVLREAVPVQSRCVAFDTLHELRILKQRVMLAFTILTNKPEMNKASK